MTKTTSKTKILEGKSVEVFIGSKTYWLRGNWQWDLHCDAIFCSDIILSLPASFSGTSGIIHPDDLAHVKEKLFLVQEVKPISLQFRIITTYGEIKTLNGSSVFFTGNGNILSQQVTEEELFKELRLLQLQKELDHYQTLGEITNMAERLSSSGTWYFNTATYTAWFSDNVYRIYGLPPQSLNAHLHTFTPFIHPDDKAVLTDVFDRAYKEQVPLQIQFRIIGSDGKEKWLHQSIQWSYSSGGERIISGWIRDETEEKLLELQLENLINETYFQKQFIHMDEQAAGLGHWYINLLTRKVVFSDNCFRLHGLKTKTLTSGFDTFLHFVHTDDQEMVQDAYKRIRSEHVLPELEYRIIRTDGKTRYLRQQGKVVVVAGEIVVMGYMQDVTAQKLGEKNIQELKETALLHRFLETEAEGMAQFGNWLWDIQTDKIIYSDGMYQLLGYKPRSIELTQKHLQRMVHLEDRKRFVDELALVIKEERETEFEFRLMRLGAIRQIRALFRLKDYDGRKFFLAILQDVTTEYEIRRQLNERIQLTELFTENILDRAFITDSNNTILFWNKACEEGYRIKREDAIGKNFFDVFPSFKNEEQFGLFNSVLKGETVLKQQVRSVSNNEYYDLRMLPLKNDQGEVFGIMHVMHDVNKEYSLQQNLTERLHFIESLLAATIDRIIVLDRNMNYQYWNHRAEMYYGIRKEEVIGKNILELFPAFIEDPSYGEFRKVLRGETIHIPATQNLKDKKNYYETYLIPIKNERDDVTGVLWVTHDLTQEYTLRQEQKKGLEKLAEEHHRLNEAQATGHVGSYECDLATMNFSLSDEMFRIFGLEPQSVQPTIDWIDSVSHPDDAVTVRTIIGKAVENKSDYEYIGRIYRPNGEMRIIASQGKVISDEGGRPVKIVGTAQDVTEKKKSEEEILRIKDELAKRVTDKYETLFHSIDEGFVINELLYDESGKAYNVHVLEANQRYYEMLGITNSIGKGAKEIFPAAEDSWLERYHQVIATGKAVRFENYLSESDRWFELYISPIGEEGSKIFAIVFNDITQRKKADEQQVFRLKLSDELRSLVDPTGIQSVVSRLLGEHLKLDRCGYAEVDGEFFTIHRDYCAPGIASMAGRFQLEDFGEPVLKILRAGETFVVENAAIDPQLISPAHAAAQIAALIVVPLIKGGRLVAGLFAHQSKPWIWTASEIAFVEEIAERTWAAVERARAEGALRLSEERLQRMVNIPQVGVLTFDYTGAMLHVNNAFLEMVGYSREEFEARKFTWENFTPPEYVEASMHIIEQLRETGRGGPYEKEYFRKDGSRVWMMFVAADVGDNMIVEYAIDISNRKLAEETLSADLAGMTRLYGLHAKLATETNLKVALGEITAVAADFLGTDRGCIQLVSEDGRRLEMYAYEGYKENDLFIRHFLHEGFKPACEAARRDRTRLIIEDVENFAPLLDTKDREVALAEGIRAIQSTPMLARNGELVGILSNQFRQPHRPNDHELRLIDLLAWIAADFVERHRANQLIQQFYGQLEVQAKDRTHELKSSTEELQKNLTILQQAESMARIGSWELEIETGRFTWSEGMYRLFGLPQGIKVAPETYLDFALEEDRAVAQRIVNSLTKNYTAFEETLRIKKDSGISSLKVKASVVPDEKGEPQKIVGVDLDVTEIQKAEEKIKESENLLEQTAKATPDAINIFDLEQKQSIHLNNCLAEWMGITAQEMMRMGYQGRLEWVHPDDREKLKEFNSSMSLAGGSETRTIEYRLLTREGKTIWIRDRTKVFKTGKDGKPTHLLSMLEDFTGEVELRNQLLERTQYAETIINTSVNRIMLYDKEFNIIAWNRRSEEITGVSKEQAIGKNIFDLFPRVKEDEVLVKAFTDSMAGQYVYLPPKKSTYTDTIYERFYIPVKDEKGDTYAVLNMMHDVSDMVQQREELKELNKTLEKKNKELEEKNEEISSFAFIASHDLKEPLRKLYTFSDWLLQKEGESLSETGRHYIKKIANSVRRMDMLIEDVLILAKIGSDRGVEMKIDLNAVLQRAIGDMKDQIRQKEAEILAEELPVINGNSNQIFYLFKNLISNAIKFQEPGNQPVLKITAVKMEDSQVANGHAAEARRYYKICFEDNGLGFEEKYSKKIFQVFQRLHGAKEFEGTGMGLAICRKIMENHRGFIKVESEPGKGSVFSCYFPVL